MDHRQKQNIHKHTDTHTNTHTNTHARMHARTHKNKQTNSHNYCGQCATNTTVQQLNTDLVHCTPGNRPTCRTRTLPSNNGDIHNWMCQIYKCLSLQMLVSFHTVVREYTNRGNPLVFVGNGREPMVIIISPKAY